MDGERKSGGSITFSFASGEPSENHDLISSNDQANRRQRVEYIADLALELAVMAERAGEATLAGLLRLAQHEASVAIERNAAMHPERSKR